MSLRVVEAKSQGRNRVDRIGALASGVCAAHCAICALLPAAFGAFGLGILLGHEAEWAFSLVAIAFATGALVLGWRRHRSIVVTLLLALGIVGLFSSRILEMTSPHHDHHGEVGHEELHAHHEIATETKEDPHHEHEDEHSAEAHASGTALAGFSHSIGAAIGVLAGLSLLTGHILNLRAMRRRG